MLFKALLLALSATLALAVPQNGVVRPCGLKDYKCIGDNFAANSKCSRRVRGFAPGVFTVPSARFETPYFNATYVDNNMLVRGMDKCFVAEFFFNTKSNSGILGIECPWLTFESDRQLLQHWTYREDTVFNYKINGSYPMIRLTTSLNHASKLDFCKEFTFADVVALPKFHINPKDKPTANFLSWDLTYLNIFERETFHYRASMLARTFVNNLICDFGC